MRNRYTGDKITPGGMMPSGDFSCPDIEGDHVQEPKDLGEFACYSLRYA